MQISAPALHLALARSSLSMMNDLCGPNQLKTWPLLVWKSICSLIRNKRIA